MQDNNGKQKTEKNFHEGHREREMQRFKKTGLAGFAPHEMLQLLLFYVDRRKDTNITAHRLCEKFGSLRNVFGAELHELTEVEGVGERTALLIKIVYALFREFSLQEHTESGNPVFRGPEEMASYAKDLFIGETGEAVYLLSLNSRNRLIAADLIMRGSFDAVAVDIPKIVKTVMMRSAPRVVLTHNHPSGVTMPTTSDVSSTREVAAALSPLNVTLVDHLVVGGGRYTSFLEMGLPLK